MQVPRCLICMHARERSSVQTDTNFNTVKACNDWWHMQLLVFLASFPSINILNITHSWSWQTLKHLYVPVLSPTFVLPGSCSACAPVIGGSIVMHGVVQSTTESVTQSCQQIQWSRACDQLMFIHKLKWILVNFASCVRSMHLAHLLPAGRTHGSTVVFKVDVLPDWLTTAAHSDSLHR